MSVTYGWTRRILRIDLSTGAVETVVPDDSVLTAFLGGRGLGAKFVYDAGHVDAFAPENLLVFAAGPLTGTRTPASGRVSLSTKSPLTGTIFDSNCGGTFGPKLKMAGYDALIITGMSSEPVYLKIADDQVELKPAAALWGKNVKAATKLLRDDGSVACIGRAGEQKVLLASIMSDVVHTFGRGGVGAVMGSKRLKAVVVNGTGSSEICDEKEFERQQQTINRLLVASPTITRGLAVFGTPFLVKITNWMNILPIANFQQAESRVNMNSFFGKSITERCAPRKRACYSCPIACKREDPAGGELPEYETIGMMSANLRNENYDAIVKANRLCNDYGMDTISVGAVLGCYAELRNAGIGGIELVALTEQIGEQSGIGARLGRGAKRFAESEHHPEIAMEVKGLELPAYDPRGVKGLGFSYATSNRGGCHTRAYLVAPEILRKPKAIDPYTLVGKAGHTKIFQDRFAAVDSLVVCKFAFFGAGEEEYANILSAVTGVAFTSEDLMRIGERIWNLERLYNLRAGFRKDNDILPARFFDETVNGRVINREEFLKTRTEYYRMRGWDDNGVPTFQTLKRLGLDQMIV
ncbi:MAG: aldehyde ferredoxin oxidoreductase family protein [Candidatus Methanospirareceae archaeon]